MPDQCLWTTTSQPKAGPAPPLPRPCFLSFLGSPCLSFHVLVFILRVSLPRAASSCERQFLSVSQCSVVSMSSPEGGRSLPCSQRGEGPGQGQVQGCPPESGCTAPPSPAVPNSAPPGHWWEARPRNYHLPSVVAEQWPPKIAKSNSWNLLKI